MLVANMDDVDIIHTNNKEEIQLLEFGMEILVNALTGQVNLHIIRIISTIKKKKVTILIDSGSTYSFINQDIAHHTGCIADPTTHMLIGIAIVTKWPTTTFVLTSSGQCKATYSLILSEYFG